MTKGDTEVSCKQPQSSWKSDDGSFQHRNKTFIVRGTLSSPAKKVGVWIVVECALQHYGWLIPPEFKNSIQSLLMLSWREKKKQKSIIKSLPSWKIDFFLFMLADESWQRRMRAQPQYSTARLYAWRTLEWAKHRRATLQIIIVQKSILLSSHWKASMKRSNE